MTELEFMAATLVAAAAVPPPQTARARIAARIIPAMIPAERPIAKAKLVGSHKLMTTQLSFNPFEV